MNIDTSNCNTKEQIFHNAKINICEMDVPFEKIKFWEGNLRTLLAFEILKDEKGQSITDLGLEEVTKFLAKRSELELSKLAKNINNNGVRVPLIITSEGKLLDGNRRFFACSILFHKYKKENKEIPGILKKIPVWVVRAEDLDEGKERKILAETNFVKELKVPWSLDVKAKVIHELYEELKEKGKSPEEIYLEISDLYSLNKSVAKSYIDTIELTTEYLQRAADDKQKDFKLREILLSKFVYFWEFHNKACTGRGQLDERELLEVKPLFFDMIEHGRFKNLKQIEPMIRSYREDDLWAMLKESCGVKIDEAVIFYNERKTIKSSEDKVRNFLRWLKESEATKFSNSTFKQLYDLNMTVEMLLKEQKE